MPSMSTPVSMSCIATPPNHCATLRRRADSKPESMTQQVRLSQFVITYGPGAILEGQNGPRVIPRPDIGLFSGSNFLPSDFEISDQPMSEGLLGGARIFRLPSNAERQVSDSWYL